jgi:hypothetical protein
LGTHKVSQHERTPPHGSFCSEQEPAARQRPVVPSQEWLQQSLSVWQRSPSPRQKFMKAHLPVPPDVSQKPEQQLVLPLHASPSVVQPVPRVVQTCVADGQLSSQQSALTVQAAPACLQLPVAEHWPATQLSEQQSAACVHEAPGTLHSLVTMQREAPPGSCSHSDEQQAGDADGVQVSPTRRQALAAMSHLPATQLSVQQSLLTAQVWW